MFEQRAQILIVDDLQSERQLLKNHLRRIGFRNIFEASDGREALQMMLATKTAGNPFDLVISDWVMPNISGIQLLKWVRSIEGWETLPFILLTAEGDKEKVIEAVQTRVSSYLVKPVDEGELTEKLSKVWQKANPPA